MVTSGSTWSPNLKMPFSMKAMFLTCFVLVSLSAPLWAVDPVFSPETITDSVNNVADRDSIITWSPIPTGRAYAVSDNTTANSVAEKAMALFFALANSFINTVFPSDFPTDLVDQGIKGTLDLGAQWQDLVFFGMGYGICIIIGILFIFLFTLIGCCFCCCRCCNNCGGKMQHKQAENVNCKRIVFSVFLLILTVVNGVGLACVFLTNERFTETIDQTATVVTNNLEDVEKFMLNTFDEVTHIARTDVSFALDVVFRDLDNIDYLVGIPVRDRIGADGKVTTAFDSVLGLDAAVTAFGNNVDTVDADKTDLQTKVDALSSVLATVKTDLDTTCGEIVGGCPPALDTSVLALKFDTTQFPDISAEISQLNAARAQDLTATVTTARTDFDNIPERVGNESAAQFETIKTQATDFTKNIDPLLDQFAEFTNITSNGQVDVGQYIQDINGYIGYAKDYNKYRWYGGLGLGCIILLIVMLQFLGLLFGFCGSSPGVPPTERSCLSNSGGEMLMASVGFVFIFSWLLMLLTTLTFAIGAPMDRYVCQPLTDPEFKVLSSTIDKPDFLQTGYLLGGLLFQNSSIPLTISGVLSDCKNDKAAYAAFKLENLFDITDYLDITKYLDITGEISKINVDFSTVQILTPELSQQLDDFKGSLTLDVLGFQTELAEATTQGDLTALAADIQTLADSLPGPDQIRMNAHAAEVTRINNNEYADVNTAKVTLSTDLVTLDTSKGTLPAQIDTVKADLTFSENFLQNNASALVDSIAQSFGDRILSVINSLTSFVKKSLNEDVGKCTPIWNIYNSLIAVTICSYIVDNLNAFWLSLGWCVFFFVPSIILSVKLAKHFRRMKFSDSFDDLSNSGNKIPLEDMNAKPPPYSSR